jgi:hypothetical protein
MGGCNSDGNKGLPPLISSNTDDDVSDPPDVVTGPTLAPDPSETITPREEPDFPVITPPPVVPDLPDLPDGNLQLTQLFYGYQLDFTGLEVPGVIADVDIQALNLTCGTDITPLLDEDALAGLESALIGRGNTYDDRDGDGITNDNDFNDDTDIGSTPSFRYSIPIEPVEAAFDGRILVKALRDVPVATEPGGELTFESQLTGDDIVFIVTITDSFGQFIRIEDFIFDAEDERVGYGCGSFVFSSP